MCVSHTHNVCVCVYILYIYMERERERERCIYVYIIYIHIYCVQEHVTREEGRCPAVLSRHLQDSRYGVAGTMLNDHTKWVNPDYVCHGELERDRERDCKTAFKHSYHDGNAYCQPMHNFIACMCNACEYDVEKLLGGFHHFGHCHHLERVKGEQPECANWWTDECESEAGKGYCSKVVDSDAWKRLQPPPPPPPDSEWDDDGMKWGKFCSDVVKELALNPEQLDNDLGLGWEQWCNEKLGVNATQETPPWGTGFNGHSRLPISGMPAPRFFDHEDSVPAGADPIGNGSVWGEIAYVRGDVWRRVASLCVSTERLGLVLACLPRRGLV